MKLSADLRAFCQRIGYDFSDPDLLHRSLTHSSLSSPTRADNQRLEFLGDRVLGLSIAEALLADDAAANEGQLAPRFNALVRKETCADVARALDIGAVLKIGKSEMANGGRRKEALLGDAMEAVIGAVYLDGGFEAARDLVLRHWASLIATVEADARDPKTALQELLQARGEAPPSYVVVERTGPDHAPKFLIEVKAGSGEISRAEAGSKRQAEQAAAADLLERLQSD